MIYNQEALKSTTALQNKASNPNNSVFVAASAGSGKTKILTDRVLRLLLLQISPAKILCLTFTKVAAAEMQNRIYKELQNWVLLDENLLKARIFNLTKKTPTNLEIKQARKLFMYLLDDSCGVQILTIHAFCQNLIKKFPIEAGISPNFEVIDEQTESQLLQKARKELLELANFDKALEENINLVAAKLNENSFLDITAEIIRSRQNLSILKQQYFDIDGIKKQIYQTLKIGLEETEGAIFNNFINDKNWQKQDLLQICQKTTIKSKENLEKFLLNSSQDDLSNYLDVFLTANNEPRKKLAIKEVQKQFPQANEIMLLEQERILEFLEKSNSEKIAKSTSSLLFIVDKIINLYSQLKTQNSYLDYNDLIIKTQELLENSQNKEWIKYKLDSQIEHILVDESQDTNNYQWNIIKAITEEFFSGNNTCQQDRTIFVVGDEKQSIYSFQGADPAIFANIFYYYQDQLNLINHKIESVELVNSFRSVKSILKAVDLVFAKQDHQKAISKLANKISHNAIKIDDFGRVELWPTINVESEKEEESEDKFRWKLDFEVKEKIKSQDFLAKIIVKTVKKWLDEKRFLQSQNRPVEPKDIMILLKERKSDFSALLIKYFNQEQIEVSPRDKITLTSHIIVQDLIALGKFILLNADDLNLACLLKSPLIGISEEELFDLCIIKNKQQISLFDALLQSSDSHIQEKSSYLNNLIEQNQQNQLSIYQLFSYVLLEKQGRKTIIAYFGIEGEEILNQFLKLCLDYEQNNRPHSLQNFIYFLENNNFTVKIDQNQQEKNQIRITTIHSAKGLEAPIVFLADSMHSTQKQFGADKRKIFWHENSLNYPLPFWLEGKASDNKLSKEIRWKVRQEAQNEYLRQLYVAMTRAGDELYITGFGKQEQTNCWHNIVKEAIFNEAIENDFDFNSLLKTKDSKEFLIGKGLILTNSKNKNMQNIQGSLFTNLEKNEEIEPLKELTKIADSLKKIPEIEGVLSPIYPSNLKEESQLSEESNNNNANLGTTIHKLLELLPSLDLKDQKQRDSIALQYLESNYDFNDKENEEILQRIYKIIDDKELSYLFESNYQKISKAEVPIMATINGKLFSGKIDRLIVKEKEVMIIDFKTGHKKPESTKKHQEQIKIYQQAIRKLYPEKEIICKIIYV